MPNGHPNRSQESAAQPRRWRGQGGAARAGVWLIAVVCCVGGCDRDEVTTYRAPKAPVHAAHAPAAPRPEPIAFDVPAGWRVSPTKQAMRYATFLAGPADAPIEVAVTVFPGDVGGVLANVNRWREQISLGKVTDLKQLPGAVAIDSPALHGLLLDMTGKSAEGAPERMIAAMLRSDDERTWFVKATGRPELLEPIKDEVIAFAKSFRVPQAGAAREAAQAPVNGSAGGLGWTTPENWQRSEAASKMLLAEFNADTSAGPVRVTVSELPGDGGGALSNINRWRGQVGLPPVAGPGDQPVVPLMVGGAGGKPAFPGAIFDLTAPKATPEGTPRMVIAMIAGAHSAIFLKLTGDAPAVEKEKAAFEQFVKSLQVPQ